MKTNLRRSNSRSNTVWDLAILGAGTAGIVAAKTAVSLGATALLIESKRPGGDCLWTGCIPSKALLSAAKKAHDARNAGKFGVNISGISINFPEVMRQVQDSIAEIGQVDSVAALEEAGVTVMKGYGVFTSDRTLEVDGTVVEFRRAVIATGAGPVVPNIPGLERAKFLTSDTVWNSKSLPENLLVIGGGSIGCELGQAFARLGSNVTIVEASPNLIPREDPSAAIIVEKSLTRDGVKIYTGTKVVRVRAAHGGSGAVEVKRADGSMFDVKYDDILLAIGRSPSTSNLKLENARVERSTNGFLLVNRSLRTTNERIYAAGDVTGFPQFTHVAGVHASMAATNAVLGLHRKVRDNAIPRVTFTDPEVASVGVDTGANSNSAPTGLVTRDHNLVDRAILDKSTDGFSRLALDSKGRIVGGTIVGPRAGESIAEVTLAIQKRLRTRDLASAIHAYPTYSDGLWNASIMDVKNQLESTIAKRIISLLRFVNQIGSYQLRRQLLFSKEIQTEEVRG